MEFKQKTVTVEGKDYVLQKLPVRQALALRQSWTLPTGMTDDVTMYDACLKHIVVNPKVTIEDFDNIAELEQLIGECVFFQYVEKKEKTSTDKLTNNTIPTGDQS